MQHHPASRNGARETGSRTSAFLVDNLKTPGRSFGRFVNANASGRRNPNSVACARVFLKANLYAEDTTGTLFRVTERSACSPAPICGTSGPT